ncbi:NAD-dependent epimerase/dehydratase family protein [Actinokineospora enzanensis]|uniref:NAD-dependent epimerase/dehydratase family protein n=1 Tax=Actinokineospora enzanensis TaxID=155975 RepID=UPI0003750F6E|nr:NAD-dependent epimerase/dehydratase family protein [Actinokineospora enzanensis]
MEIVGNGFLARHLHIAFGDRHPEVTALAAGVTRTIDATAAEFDREAALVYDVTRRCRADGRTVVFFSTASDSMYGGIGATGAEDGPVFPTSAYGRHKLAMEAVLAASGARHLTLRLAHVLGVGQRPHQLLPALVGQVRAGRVTIFRHAHRDLVDVRDVVGALDGLLASDTRDTVVNVASGVLTPVERIVEGIERRLGTRVARRYVDRPVVTTATSVRRLRALVPDWPSRDDADHADTLLDRYVGRIPAAVPA